MHDQLEPQSIGSDEPAGNGAATPRDVQRAALRSLIDLSTSAAEEEARIEQEHQQRLETARSDLKTARIVLEQQIAQQTQAAQAKHEQRTSHLGAKFDAELKAASEAFARAKATADLELQSAEREVKKQFDQAAWLAESVHEATVAQAREDARQDKLKYGERIEQLDAMENKLAELLHTYGATSLAQTHPPEIKLEGDPAELYDKHLQAAQLALRRFDTLPIPRLFVGLTPWIVGVLVVGLAVGGTYLADGGGPPDISRLAIVGGIALAAFVVVAIGLRFLARSQIRQAYAPLRAELTATRNAAKAHLDHLARERDSRVAESKRKTEAEIDALKKKFAPVRAQARHHYDQAIEKAKAQYDEIRARVSAEREKALAEVDAWLAQTREAIEQRRERKLREFQERHDQAIAEAEQQYAQARAALQQRWDTGLAEIADPIHQSGSSDGRAILRWEQTDWNTWQPPQRFAQTVRFGELQVDLQRITDKLPRSLRLPEAFSLPAGLAFPRHSSLLIHTDREGRPEALDTLRMVMSRLLTSLPAGRVRFTIIDPVGLGQNFAGFMHLADHDEALVGSRIWTESEHIEQRLADLTEHMETVIQKYLRNEFETIDEYNAQAGELAEPYRFLVIADFPVGFEGDSFRRLASIASSGARCGVYTLVLRDLRTPLPSGTHIDELEQHSINLVRENGRFVWRDEVFQQFPLKLDPPPSEQTLTQMLDVVGRHAKESKRVEVPFTAIAPKPEQFWSLDSSSELSVAVGRMGATRQQHLRLGKGVAQHALIAGKTGSGKSTLLHAIVTNLAMWYSPDQVELYLVDFKKGVEFKTYATHSLPHARAIAVESDREFGLSVLQRIDAELTRRGELFRKVGVQDLASYRREVPGDVMPRTVLIIDEFQEFFSEDDKLAQDAAVLLDRLVRQGRAFGIHVLLGSQTIAGSSGLSRSTIGQIAVRIALQTSEADSQLILGDNNSAARLLSRPGEAIYNDAGGLVEGNSPFQVAWLPDEQRDVFLEQVQDRAKQQGVRVPEPIVFEGNVPADVRRNRLLAEALDGARLDGPPRAWLGEPVAIKEPTAVPFRRQPGANMLIIGQQDEQAMAIIGVSMISLAAQHGKDRARFVLMDGTPADSDLAGRLEQVAAVIPQQVERVEYRQTAEAIDELARELARRQEQDDPDAPTIYLVIYGLQRYRVLRKSEEGFSFSLDDAEKPPQPDKQFADLLRDGPGVGIHVIAWCDTPAAVERTIERSSMREFDNRILFQMSAADSSNLIDSPAANKLGFFRALAYSEEQGMMEKFRPYALPDAQWLQEVGEKLQKKA